MSMVKLGTIVSAGLALTVVSVGIRSDLGSANPRRRALDAYARLPLAFVENRGQQDDRVRYYAHGNRYAFYLTRDGVVLSFAKGSVALRFRRANPEVRLEGAELAAGTVNYIRGSDPSQWRTELPHYSRVIYRDLWPGIDLHLSEQHGTLKYEFHVRAGAHPADIRMTYSGAADLAVD